MHVSGQDGLADGHPGALSAQRALVEKLGGTYHQVVGEDVPHALVDFAKASNATQLVIGVSRRSRLAAALSGPGIGATVVRESGVIDVHIVTHEAAGGRFALPRLGGALTVKRRVLGMLTALIGGPLLTLLLASFRSTESIASDVLGFQLLVVIVALVGGLWPALFAAVLSGLTLDFFFIEPIYRVTIASPLHSLALALYIVNAVLVSYVVDQAARRSRSAVRALAESQLLATISGSVLRGQDALQALLTRTQEAFRLSSVRLCDGETVLYSVGEPRGDDHLSTIPVGDHSSLELSGPDLLSSERRLLAVIAAQIDAAMEHSALTKTAEEIRPLAEADRMRSALLAAVGHDLRRPLAAATAAVSGLQSTDIQWSEPDRSELLSTAQESLDSLAALVTDLLDVSRLQAGALAVSARPLDVADIILPALDELRLGPADVELGIEDGLPDVLADAGLLQRVLVNLLDNALRFSPPDVAPRLSASSFAGAVEIRIADRGPGVATERKDDIFVPFQRLGDTDNTTGLGLGLALSKGFVEGMAGTLHADDTPGGGLTMVITLPAAPHDSSPLEGTA